MSKSNSSSTFLKYKLFMYEYWRNNLKCESTGLVMPKNKTKINQRICYLSEVVEQLTGQINKYKVDNKSNCGKAPLFLNELHKALLSEYNRRLFTEKYKLCKKLNHYSNHKEVFIKHDDFFQVYTKHFKFLNTIRDQLKMQYKQKPHNIPIFEKVYHPDNVIQLMQKGYTLGQIDVILYDKIDVLL